MADFTTVKVTTRTRDTLRELADREGRTLDAQMAALIRRERRRIMGQQMSADPLSSEDLAVLDASASDVGNASR